MTMPVSMTSAAMYDLRTTNLLPLPKGVQDVIGSMQLAPVAQVFVKKMGFKKPAAGRADRDPAWRRAMMLELKLTEFKKDDPDYEAVVSIINKVAMSTIGAQTTLIREILEKRDEMFRLRVVSLLFEQGVSMPFFSKMMANIFELLFATIPAIKDDLQESCSIDIFEKMFNLSETITFPAAGTPNFDNLVIAWNKKKELRRGFGMFATELHLRGLIDEAVIASAINTSISDLEEMMRSDTDKHIAESVDQLVTFLFDSAKVLVGRFGKAHSIFALIAGHAKKIYAVPKDHTPCLGMRSRFRLDDIGKLK